MTHALLIAAVVIGGFNLAIVALFAWAGYRKPRPVDDDDGPDTWGIG